MDNIPTSLLQNTSSSPLIINFKLSILPVHYIALNKKTNSCESPPLVNNMFSLPV